MKILKNAAKLRNLALLALATASMPRRVIKSTLAKTAATCQASSGQARRSVLPQIDAYINRSVKFVTAFKFNPFYKA
ncbi:MAG: hypothetical protein ACFNTA_00530 [Campylobacter sp.]|uniref:hypothetical protein n=1 Tax=Campylobacter sp. TaxID=205 RepID=UPI00361E9FFA